MPFPFYKQYDQMDCGPTCLRMISKYYGRNYTLEHLRELSQISRDGVSLLGISEASERIGFRSLGAKLSLEQLKEANLPCILHWQQNHFVILYKIRKMRYYVADPAMGLYSLSEKEFVDHWLASSAIDDGISLLLSPTPQFYEIDEPEKSKGNAVNWISLLRYLIAYRQLLIQLVLALFIGTLLQLIAPFLTQAVVDIGINSRNLNFVNVILIAQLTLYFGNASIGFIRSWIMLHVTTRINMSILTDFLIKLMKLPMGFFDTKMTGDILQRMGDQGRIQNFLTGASLEIGFSAVNLIVFSAVLIAFNVQIFFVFIVSSILYAGWILLFLKSRRELDFKHFDISAKNQSTTIQLIHGMQEIKLNNFEKLKRWDWEFIQARLFKINVRSLALGQYQHAGGIFINQITNIIITYISAKSVISGEITLGAMMAIQYIVGQLNAPIEQFIGFIQSFQDAKISLERLNEVQTMEDEEPAEKSLLLELPSQADLTFNNFTFRYPGAGNEPVLKNINLRIPFGKTTAIVGMSGSGKTTILKLLLRFYKAEGGDIRIGDKKLDSVSLKLWREQCGVVMQEGFIFSDTIAKNIAVGDSAIDKEKLAKAIELANISDLIESLPNELNTKIGAEGNGISQGQKQRLLIARAVYKNPSFIFFDEATNALDATNEKVIMNNLERFFLGKTVVVVAHRLSTVKNADKIIVMEKGEIIETGTHKDLVKNKGAYFNLVKNQLELDS